MGCFNCQIAWERKENLYHEWLGQKESRGKQENKELREVKTRQPKALKKKLSMAVDHCLQMKWRPEILMPCLGQLEYLK